MSPASSSPKLSQSRSAICGVSMIFLRACKGVPTVILADTIKGKGVSFMEGKSAWHGKAIPDAEFAQAMQELGGNV